MKTQYLLIAIMALLIIIPAWTQETGKIIRATMFVLEDDQGRERGAFWADSNGPKFHLIYENGLPGIIISVKNNGTVLTLYDEKSEASIALSITEEGQGILFRDGNSGIRFELSLTAKGPRLVMYDENDNIHVGMIVDKSELKVIFR